jgi:serine/threonine protein kinase
VDHDASLAQTQSNEPGSPDPKQDEQQYKVVHGSSLLPNLPADMTEELDKKSIVIGSYKITKTLGQGTFGKVKEGIHLFTKQKVKMQIQIQISS